MSTISTSLYPLTHAEDALPDFRNEIRERLKALGKTTYWLTTQVSGRVGPNTVYDFLREETPEKKPSEIGSDKLQLLYAAIERAEREKAKQSKGN